MGKPKLTLYVDVVSVFTYFAFYVINVSQYSVHLLDYAYLRIISTLFAMF